MSSSVNFIPKAYPFTIDLPETQLKPKYLLLNLLMLNLNKFLRVWIEPILFMCEIKISSNKKCFELRQNA